MSITRRWQMFSLAVTIALLLAACGESSTQPEPDFTLSPGSSAVSVAQGGTTEVTVGVTRSGGFTGAVALEVTGVPAGVTASFNPASVPAGGTSSTLTLTLANNVAPGTYSLTVVASSGNLAKQRTLTLTVTNAVQPDFSLALSSATATVAQGGTTEVAITVTRTGGFTGDIDLTLEGAPAGVVAVFDPLSIVAGGTSSTLTLAVSNSVAPGTYPLRVVATSDGITRERTLTLTVTEAGAPTTLDQEAAERLAALAGLGNGFTTVVLEPQRLLRGFSLEEDPLPGPLLNLLFRSGVYLQQEEECIIVEGDETDNDEDGVPVEALYTIQDCQEFSNGTVTTVSGMVYLQDENDNDPTSGYIMEIADYIVTEVSEEAWNVIYLEFFVGVARLQLAYQMLFDFTIALASSEIEEDFVAMAFEYDQIFIPSDPARPFASGTFGWEGALVFTDGNTTYGLVTETQDMFYSEGCEPPAFNSGSTRYYDTEENFVEINYVRCSTYETFYNGEWLGETQE